MQRRLYALGVASTLLAGLVTATSTTPALAAYQSIALETPSVIDRVDLGSLASRSQQRQLVKSGSAAPYTMTGTDSLTGLTYQYLTEQNYTSNATLRESDNRTMLSDTSVTEGVTMSTTWDGKTATMLTSSGGIQTGNSRNGLTTYGSAFGPQVWSVPFTASAGQQVSFEWSAKSGQDDYEIYGFLVKVAGGSNCATTTDYGLTNPTTTHTILAYGRGTVQSWLTATGVIQDTGCYRFRFVHGTYDQTGGYAVGATLYVSNTVLLGRANVITFTMPDRIVSATPQTVALTATSNSDPTGANITYQSLTTTVCTVSGQTLTLLANRTGACSLRADSAAAGDYVAAPSTYTTFQVLAAATAPTTTGGNIVAGDNVSCATLTAQLGSWGDGGQPITSTTYQWKRNGVAIAGATSTTYQVTDDDVGTVLAFDVTRTNSVGSTTAASSGVTIIDTRLSGLALSAGSLSPAFASCTTAYATTVGVSTIRLTPTVADANATVTVNGNAVVSGTQSPAISLTLGANAITLVVTNGTKTATRTLTVTYQAAPTVTIQAPSNVSGTDATLNATVNANGSLVTSISMQISDNARFTGGLTRTLSIAANPNASLTADESVAAAASSFTDGGNPLVLAQNTRYYYRATATNALGTSTSAVFEFVTPDAPQVTTSAASGASSTGITLNGSVNPLNSNLTSLEFEYDTDPMFASPDTATVATPWPTGNTATSVSSAVTGLVPGVTYYFRLRAANVVNRVTLSNVGGTRSFMLQAAPTVSAVTSTPAHNTVTFSSSVDFNGASTTVTFTYGTASDLTGGITVNASPASVTAQGAAVSSRVTGLTPSTTYYVRINASNAAGSTSSSIVSFTTLADPKPTAVISGPTSTSGAVPITIVVTFSEAVTGFLNTDLTLSGASAGWARQTAQEIGLGGTTYQVELRPTNVAVGTLTVNLAANVVTDSAGQGNLAATSFSVAVVGSDSIPPTLSLAQGVGAQAGSTYVIAVTASESISGLTTSDVTITPNTLGWTVNAVAGSGSTYTVTLGYGSAQDGQVSVAISAGAVQDAAGNSNALASNSLTVALQSGSVFLNLAAPGAPVPGTITRGETTLRLEFAAAAGTVSGYTVEYTRLDASDQPVNGSTAIAQCATTAPLRCDIQNLTADTKYSLVLTAGNAAGTTSASAVTARTLAAPLAPPTAGNPPSGPSTGNPPAPGTGGGTQTEIVNGTPTTTPVTVTTGSNPNTNRVTMVTTVVRPDGSTSQIEVALESRSQGGQTERLSPAGSLVLVRGSLLRIQGSGYKPNSPVSAWMFSTPVFLGSALTDSNGTVDAVLPVPEIPDGTHVVELIGSTPSNAQISLAMGVTVTSPVPVSPLLPMSLPKVEGQPLVGQILVCQAPEFSELVTSWVLTIFVDGSVRVTQTFAGSGIPSLSYTVSAADAGFVLTCVVRASVTNKVSTATLTVKIPALEANDPGSTGSGTTPAVPGDKSGETDSGSMTSPKQTVRLSGATVVFDAMSTRLSASARRALSQLDLRRANLIRITGFTRKGSNPALTERLSRGRAQAVKTYLVNQGFRGQVVVLSGGQRSGTGSASDRRARVELFRSR